MIKLNVGGQIFTTTIDTLTKKSNYFKKLFEFNSHDDDEIFIDRCPKLFEVVLNYMRTNTILKTSCGWVYDEMEFYGIDCDVLNNDMIAHKQFKNLGQQVYDAFHEQSRSDPHIDLGVVVTFDQEFEDECFYKSPTFGNFRKLVPIIYCDLDHVKLDDSLAHLFKTYMSSRFDTNVSFVDSQEKGIEYFAEFTFIYASGY